MLKPQLVEHIIDKPIYPLPNITPEIKKIKIKPPLKPISKPKLLINVEPIKSEKVIKTQINSFILNILGVICIGVVCALLYYRMKNKSGTKEEHIQNIVMLNNNIHKFERNNIKEEIKEEII